MQVTNIRVSFLREKQPAQYEKAAPAVEFSAVIDPGEDHAAVARKLMIDATSIVYAGIGYDTPAPVAKALASGKVPAEVAVEVETTEAAAQAPLTAEKVAADGSDVPGDEVAEKPAPKKRGRPKGSTNTRPKAGSKAAEKAAAAATKTAEKPAPTKAADVPDDDIPGDPPRVGPKDDPKDHGVESVKAEPLPSGETEVNVFTAKDLHTIIIDLINEKKLSVPSAKQLLAHFQVARAQDLTPEQVAEGKVMIEKMVSTVS